MGCASFQTVSISELELRHLIGRWSDGSGAELVVYCSGAISYDIKNSSYLFAAFENKSCHGCVIQEIQDNQLIIGPMIINKLEISKWPYSDGANVKMMAAGHTWILDESESCTNNK